MSHNLVSTLRTRDDWAILSAERVELSETANAHRSHVLARILRDEYSGNVRRIFGRYGGTEEISFLAFGISPDDALTLARAFGQESILTSRGLVYCDGRGIVPSRGIEPGTDPDAQSVDARTGEAFVSVLDWDAQTVAA